ncbi:uncharacterized protein LOC123547156 [Mercenaria mercenaria]|uniref:uncharacterized protein LOC123547156 n=1 Tax=Mercenaria mercenaria TaxID=6596 RepID=UPI00234F0C0E|nr:uncharacterized protein LOC123547156 [Mercenaria mercenaria]
MKYLCTFWFMFCIGAIGIELLVCSEKLQHTFEVIYQKDGYIKHDNKPGTKDTLDHTSYSHGVFVDVFLSLNHGKTGDSNLGSNDTSSIYQEDTVRYTNDLNTRGHDNLLRNMKIERGYIKTLIPRDKASNDNFNQFLPDTSLQPVAADVSDGASHVQEDHSPLSADKPGTKLHKQNASSAKENIEQMENVSFNFTGNDNKTPFEEYERLFILGGIKNWLEQFLHFESFRNHTDKHDLFNTSKSSSQTTGNPGKLVSSTALPYTEVTTASQSRVDPIIIEEKMRQLNQMNMSQLTHIFGNLTTAAEKGQVDMGIANLCCPIG